MEENKIIKVYVESRNVAFRFVSDPKESDIIIKEDGTVTTTAVQEIENVSVFKKERTSTTTSRGKNNLDVDISNILSKLGIPVNVRGYRYIREALKIIIKDNYTISSLTKVIYPEVASKFDTISGRVERAIRHAIEIAFIRGNSDFRKELFNNSFGPNKIKPTNAAFLAGIADYYRMSTRKKQTNK